MTCTNLPGRTRRVARRRVSYRREAAPTLDDLSSQTSALSTRIGTALRRNCLTDPTHLVTASGCPRGRVRVYKGLVCGARGPQHGPHGVFARVHGRQANSICECGHNGRTDVAVCRNTADYPFHRLKGFP